MLDAGSYAKDRCPGCGGYWSARSPRPVLIRTQHGEIIVCEPCYLRRLC